jgi:glutamate synthase domain-containing protein 2/glutamate synthase domain-containing protein 1/glutamate synthase domain-containing protein 3
MYQVLKNGKLQWEADACGIGFIASRKGVAERELVQAAIDLAGRFDHRGAPGHGAGMQLDIPWPILLDRFPLQAKLIAQRDVALGMFFLPFDSQLRRDCVEAVERLANVAGAPVLEWADVPINDSVLPEGSNAKRTVPVVRQALFRRPEGMREDAWFACRYLLRLALDSEVGPIAGDNYSCVSLSNRTTVYKGLCELSKLADFYPDLANPDYASRYALFHSRYCTNTTTAWRRAQPFWAIAHNGEINTIQGNVAWMEAIGKDLLRVLTQKYPALESIAQRVRSVVCSGGSDTANLDDMLIALIAGGMSMSASILALLPEAQSIIEKGSPLGEFYRAMGIYLGACDGPAAIVACDGDEAVAHLDRNGLRPLWFTTTKDYAVAASELTGTFPLGDIELQKILGPGDTVSVKLNTGVVLLNEGVHEEVSRQSFPPVAPRTVPGEETALILDLEDLVRVQRAFGMTKEDVDVVLEPLIQTGKPAIGSMGDDTPPASMLDALPRRLEDYFVLRFAQETSPPIDPIRDAWVFDTSVALGDRAGLWGPSQGPVYQYSNRILGIREGAWLEARDAAKTISLLFDADTGSEGLEARIDAVVEEAVRAVKTSSVLILSDRGVDDMRAAAPILRAISRIHSRLVRENLRHHVGLVADAGVWDIHHCALLIAVGADAVIPWLGCATAQSQESTYLKGLRSGFVEAMSMMGVTPASAYCGARLIEAIGLDSDFLAREFPGVPGHMTGIGPAVLNPEWLGFHREAFPLDELEERELVAVGAGEAALPDVGEFRHSKSGRPHANNAEIVRSIQLASGYAKKIHASMPGSWDAYQDYSALVSGRSPVTLLDCLAVKPGDPIALEDVESEEQILWRFMAPGMSEGALSEPAHRAVAHAMNLLNRYCRIKFAQQGMPVPQGMGPFANSGEGGFEKSRMGTREGNTSVQYAGGRFTITPMTASRANEAEVKFAQGAKPGKGGQLPGKKVGRKVAVQRGCEPGYELVSPPINHNLYSIEDVKLMLESWRHLNPSVNCALKYVATVGVEMVALGGVNAGATRLHLSDGCGGTGAAKRVDQKHAGIPVVTVLPRVQDMLVEENVRHFVEISVDGGVQNGEQALKLMMLGADRVGFGTSLLMAIGCSMLRKCHLAGPDPADPTGKRRLGCAPGVATQDPVLIAKFSGRAKHIARYLTFVAREIRERLASVGVASTAQIIGRRDLLEPKSDLSGKASLLDFSSLLLAPHGRAQHRDYAKQVATHMPRISELELKAAYEALRGGSALIRNRVSNEDRCVGLAASGEIARARGDMGISGVGSVTFEHEGAAGHFYAAYMVEGMAFRLRGVAADSCFTASYGGKLVIVPNEFGAEITVVGNAFGYGARGGRAYLAGRGGNRFGICFRKSYEGGGPRVVVEGLESNAFQYMTGGVALVLGPTGHNLGSGMTGGVVYLLDADLSKLNAQYVQAVGLEVGDVLSVKRLLEEHSQETGSPLAACLLRSFEPERFTKIVTAVKPEPVDY